VTDARRRGGLCLAVALSGCAALLNQILWTRLLGLVFGSTVEAVAIVTAVFMGGLALGSALAPRLLGRSDSAAAQRLFVRVEAVLAGLALSLSFLLPLLEGVRAAAGAAVAWPLATAALLAPSTLMGTTLVLATRALASGTDARAGALFGTNTLGAVVGVYGSVLWLLPGLGCVAQARSPRRSTRPRPRSPCGRQSAQPRRPCPLGQRRCGHPPPQQHRPQGSCSRPCSSPASRVS